MLRGRQLDLSVQADTVCLRVRCGDTYAARVLYEDLVERISRGGRVSIQLKARRQDVPAKENGRTNMRPLSR